MFNRRPVQRAYADRDFLIMLLSFGVTVVGTRLFLELTGYPQIGGSVLHIAHALWGGLLQFIALCILLTFANRWRYPISAVLGGIGVGLFIDEIGKFITQTNDYFFPFAAPLIYASIVLVTLIYLHMRRARPTQPARTNLYWVLDQLKDIIDHDFDEAERAAVEARLKESLTQDMSPELRQFTESLLQLAQSAPVVKPPQPTVFQQLWARINALNRLYVTRERLRRFLIAAYIFDGIGGLSLLVVLFLTLTDTIRLNEFVENLILMESLDSPVVLQWVLVHGMLVGIIGTVMTIGAALLFLRRDLLAVRIVRYALVVQLTVANLLAFYFDQFAMVLSTMVTVVILLATEDYRTRHLAPPNPLAGRLIDMAQQP